MAVTDSLLRRLPLAEERRPDYENPLLRTMIAAPGLSVLTGKLDDILEWGLTNSLWVFPMATSCCGIELMAAAASRVDLDRMGTIVRATPRQADVMVVAGTITVKMAPRVKTLWDQMPGPKWCIAMGSCAISGDFYRNLYPVVPGIDRVIPVDVYVPGCPPNPEALMHGLLRLQEKVRAGQASTHVRDPDLEQRQVTEALEATSHDRSDEPLVPDDPEIASAALIAMPDETREDFGTIEAAQHVTLAKRLREQGFVQLVYVVATHVVSKKEPERFEVAYALRSIGKGSRLATWKLSLEPGKDAPSLVGVFAGADWQEREQWDLVGVRFAGHPDLRRIMMPDSWEGHPLRKDFPSDKACPPWR